MKARAFFISGVPGVGKTSIIASLKSLLGEHVDVHDFDEQGVPDNVNIDWRVRETAYWMRVAKENEC